MAASASGRDDLKRLKVAMPQLIGNDAPLGPQWLDHALKGCWMPSTAEA